MAYTISTPTSDAAWRPDHFAFSPGDILPEALVLTTSTVAGSIEGDAPSVRVAFITDDTAKFYAEGDDLDEGQPTLAEALIYTSKAAMLLRITVEQYEQAGTAGQLAQSVARAVQRTADTAYVSQAAPIGPLVAPSAGLLNWPGIIDGGEIADSLDGLISLIADLESNLATPSHIVIGPQAWAALRQFKIADTYNQSLLGAGVNDAVPRLLGLPLVVSNALTDSYAGLVIDRSAVVSAVGPVKVSTSEHTFFTADSVGLKCTWRFGHTVPRPDRIGKFSVAAPGS